MYCPSCKDPVLQMSERSGIEIDYCPQCRGVWLDRGELDKLIEKTSQESRSVPASKQFARQEFERDSDEYKYKYKRKKSFLQEIFD